MSTFVRALARTFGSVSVACASACASIAGLGEPRLRSSRCESFASAVPLAERPPAVLDRRRRARPGRRRGRRPRPRRTTDPSSSTPPRVSRSTAPGRRSRLARRSAHRAASRRARATSSLGPRARASSALDAGHQQLVVARVLVPDRGRRPQARARPGSSARPAAERPTRPEPRTEA